MVILNPVNKKMHLKIDFNGTLVIQYDLSISHPASNKMILLVNKLFNYFSFLFMINPF